MEEQVLAERCRQGDNLARKELYEQYAGRMLGVCLRYAGDRETAQDLMHDGFLKLFDSFDKFTWRGEGSLRAWMERVMVNTVLQYLRKNDVMNQSAALDDVPETYENRMPRLWIQFLKKGIDAVYKRASRRLSYRIQPVCF